MLSRIQNKNIILEERVCIVTLFSKKLNIQQLVILLLLCISTTSFAQVKYSNIKIYMPADKDQQLNLLELLEIDHYHEHNGVFNYTVDKDEMELLQKSGYKFDIIHEDAIAYLEEENKKYYERINDAKNNGKVAFEKTGDIVDSIINTPAAFTVQPTFGGYYRYGQMDTAMRTLESNYPTLVQRFSIGTSVEGREMWCVKISDNPTVDESEPEILFMGMHHAREAIGGSSMIFLMQYLCEYYSKDTRIKDLVDNREIFIIVCANPDGWEWNRTLSSTGGGQWRKNRKVSGSGQFGVDLNRNWGISWADSTGAIGGSNCGTANASSDTYWGPTPYSEPETQNLRTFVRAHDFGAIMDQHSIGPYYSLPWGRNYNAMSSADDEVYKQMASVMGKYNGMRYGSTYQTLGYEVTGGMKDVMLRGDDSLPNGKVYGMTGEGSNGSSFTNFWPLASEITKLCKGMVYQDLQLIYTVGSYVDLQDKGSINIQTKNGKFYFKVRRIGLGNDTVKVSIVRLQNISSVGAQITIPPTALPNFNSTYEDSISYTLFSSIAAGNSVKFAWKIETGGYTYYDTIVNIFQANVLFSDNMETGAATTNWTINSGWAYTNDAAYTGSKSLAESPGGTTYADGVNLIAQKATNLNLSGAGAAYLSFWVKYRAENFRDFLRVEVSTNGTTWIALSGKNTVREPGNADGNRLGDTSALTGLNEFWNREIFDLKNYLGATNLRLRFRFNSGSGASTYVYDNDAGFNIDDITVITGGTPSLLPLELIEFTGHNENAVNILNWKTATELNTKNFVIEKSANGIEYEEIGVVQAAGNSFTTKDYTFTDTNPYNAENIYRLRMVDIDESFKYSKLISIKIRDNKHIAQEFKIENIYPNPTKEKVFIDLNVTEERTSYDFIIFNIFGQVVKKEPLTLTKGRNVIELNASDYVAGEYFLSFINPSKGINYEHKFIKL